MHLCDHLLVKIWLGEEYCASGKDEVLGMMIAGRDDDLDRRPPVGITTARAIPSMPGGMSMSVTIR